MLEEERRAVRGIPLLKMSRGAGMAHTVSSTVEYGGSADDDSGLSAEAQKVVADGSETVD